MAFGCAAFQAREGEPAGDGAAPDQTSDGSTPPVDGSDGSTPPGLDAGACVPLVDASYDDGGDASVDGLTVDERDGAKLKLTNGALLVTAVPDGGRADVERSIALPPTFKELRLSALVRTAPDAGASPVYVELVSLWQQSGAGTLQIYIAQDSAGLFVTADRDGASIVRSPDPGTVRLDSTPRELTLEIRPGGQMRMLIDGGSYGGALATPALIADSGTIQLGMVHVNTSQTAALSFDDLRACIVY